VQGLISKSDRHGAIEPAVFETFAIKSGLYDIKELGLSQYESAIAR